MKKIGFLVLMVVTLFTVIDLTHISIPKRTHVDDKGRKVTIYAENKVIHTYEKYVKVNGNQVIFKNDYTKMKFENAKVKYGE